MPVPFTLVRFGSFVVLEVHIIPPFHILFSALKSHFSEFCKLKFVVPLPTIVPQQPKERGGALAQRSFSFFLGKHSLWVKTQEASAQQTVWLGLVKMNLEMRPTGESGVTSSLVLVISEGALGSGGFLQISRPHPLSHFSVWCR